MRMKSYSTGLLAMLILASGSGCKKSPSEGGHPQSTVNPQPSTTLARVHWLGKKRIAAQKTSSYFMSIWNMPEAARLETQTLDKLALAMVGDQAAEARLSGISNQAPVTSSQKAENKKQKAEGTNQVEGLVNRKSQIVNPQALLLRPLLDDLVREESYLEVQQKADQPAELVLAIRLDDPRADLWTSNVSAVVASMTNIQSLPAPASRFAWRLPLPSPTSSLLPLPSHLELARVGDWTLLGVASETNGLLAELSHRILLDHTPVPAPATGSSFQLDPAARKVGPATGSPAATNHWLDVDLDLRRLSSALSLGWNLPEAWPRVAAAWTGNGEFVRTTGDLTFATPLNLQFEPWNIPTNLIHQPLVSFTALRGVRPWLARQKWFQHFQIEPVPDQFCAWASGPTPLLTFAATPMTNAASLLRRIGPRIEAELNPWITTNAFGGLEYSNQPASLAWSGIPMFTPTIEATTTPGGSFLVGYVGTPPGAGKPAPTELFAQLTRPNLVYYDWEITQAKLGNWIYHGQTARLAFVLPQMPSDSAALGFLLAVAPKLGNTGTEIIQDGPARLSFVRNSHSGFTGIELHLLADWLESPAFPRGLHTLLAPKPAKWPTHKLGAKSVPSMPAARRPRTKPLALPH
jgi:hypothetical protein